MNDYFCNVNFLHKQDLIALLEENLGVDNITGTYAVFKREFVCGWDNLTPTEKSYINRGDFGTVKEK